MTTSSPPPSHRQVYATAAAVISFGLTLVLGPNTSAEAMAGMGVPGYRPEKDKANAVVPIRGKVPGEALTADLLAGVRLPVVTRDMTLSTDSAATRAEGRLRGPEVSRQVYISAGRTSPGDPNSSTEWVRLAALAAAAAGLGAVILALIWVRRSRTSRSSRYGGRHTTDLGTPPLVITLALVSFVVLVVTIGVQVAGWL